MSATGDTLKNLKKSKTILALDGVRAIACLNVISYHIHYFIQHTYDLSIPFGNFGSAVLMSGWSGVTLFFVLSGFLLFMPYVQGMLGVGKWPSIRTFYLRRALRILPGYYISLFLLILLEHPEYLHLDHLKQIGLFLTFLMDAPLTYQQINGPFWTLAVEWQYYMLLPLLALAFRWIVRQGSTPQQRFKLILWCLVTMILWGIGTRYMGRYYTLHPSETLLVPRDTLNWVLVVIYGSSGKYLEDFAIGMLICTIYVYVQNTTEGHRLSYRISRASFWCWGSGILLLFFMSVWSVFPGFYPLFVSFIGVHNWLCELGYAVGYGLCIIAILYGRQELKNVFEGSAIRLIGRISYSLYIWHLPIILFFMENFSEKLPHRFSIVYFSYWLCVLLLIIPFSYLFYRVVELPGIRLANKSRQHKNLEKKGAYMEGPGTDLEVGAMLSHPTVYADVNVVLHDFLARVRTILGDHFCGMYLSGSLALGDFSPQRSDIDFVVVTAVELSDGLLSFLQAMHADFNASDSPWATEVEAAYIPLDALRRYDPARACHPHIERGRDEILHMDQLNGWVIQYYILREHGVVVAGPPPATLIDPIPSQNIRQAMVALMDEWWGTMTHDPTRLQYRGYQVYAVLTMCRMLYTLDSGAVVSKPIAARWVQTVSGQQWSALIEDALAWQKDRTWGEAGHKTPNDSVHKTQALIQYTLECCQKWNNMSPPMI